MTSAEAINTHAVSPESAAGGDASCAHPTPVTSSGSANPIPNTLTDCNQRTSFIGLTPA
jgi:hypothetical protein